MKLVLPFLLLILVVEGIELANGGRECKRANTQCHFVLLGASDNCCKGCKCDKKKGVCSSNEFNVECTELKPWQKLQRVVKQQRQDYKNFGKEITCKSCDAIPTKI